jgi:endonuclease YncB( thermonuclease family)
VADGDTITVLHDRQPETIRLNGIDAPEKGQAFGNRVPFASAAEAERAGYRLAGNCP